MKSIVLLLSFLTFEAGVEGTLWSLGSVSRSMRLRSRFVRDLSWEREVDFEDLKIKAECDVFGTNVSYKNAMEAYAEAEDCADEVYSSAIDEETEDPNLIFKQTCSVASDLNQCYIRYADIVKDCAAPSERASVAQLERSTYDFACAKDRLLTLILADVETCYEELDEELKECVRSAYPAETKGSGAQTLSPEQKVCKSRALIRKCVVEELKKCNSPAASNYFNDFVQEEGSTWSCPSP